MIYAMTRRLIGDVVTFECNISRYITCVKSVAEHSPPPAPGIPSCFFPLFHSPQSFLSRIPPPPPGLFSRYFPLCHPNPIIFLRGVGGWVGGGGGGWNRWSGGKEGKNALKSYKSYNSARILSLLKFRVRIRVKNRKEGRKCFI